MRSIWWRFMKIRFAQNNDINNWMELLELVKDNFPGLDIDEYKIGLSTRILEQSALVAKEDNMLIGALLFSKESKELEFLAIHPQYRREGTATALIRHMFALFPKDSCFTVRTYREDDPKGKPAVELYKRIGFIPGELITVFDYPCKKFRYTT
jgi:ribosomal protein S18 acetylase RimI-like enzyme